MARSFYNILGVSQDADDATIKAAYKALALACHPDKNVGCEEVAQAWFLKFQEAYVVLSDPAKRLSHDRELNDASRNPAATSTNPATSDPPNSSNVPRYKPPRARGAGASFNDGNEHKENNPLPRPQGRPRPRSYWPGEANNRPSSQTQDWSQSSTAQQQEEAIHFQASSTNSGRPGNAHGAATMQPSSHENAVPTSNVNDNYPVYVQQCEAYFVEQGWDQDRIDNMMNNIRSSYDALYDIAQPYEQRRQQQNNNYYSRRRRQRRRR